MQHMQHDSQPPSCIDPIDPIDPPPLPEERPWHLILMMIGTVLVTILLAFVPRDVVDQIGAYGYIGVFVLTLLASATILMPSPALGAALLAGKTLNPWLVGVLGGVAAGLGETTGYIAGYGGSTFARQSRFYPRIEGWVKRWGILTVFLLAAIPLPLIDLAGIAAGTLRMRFRDYLLACLAGKTLRFVGVAWLGWFLGQTWL